MLALSRNGCPRRRNRALTSLKRELEGCLFRLQFKTALQYVAGGDSIGGSTHLIA